MLPSLCAILEPPAPAIRTRRAREYFIPPERDAIPVITMRGRTLMVRSVTPSDAPLLADMLARLSLRSTQLRFFRPLTSTEALWREAERVAGGDPRQRVALVATSVEDGTVRVTALAELAHNYGDLAMAEFAIVVCDDYQQEGLGSMLAQLMVQVVLLRGGGTLRAEMLAENRAIRKLVRGLGLPYTVETHWGETTALLTLPQG